MTAGSGPPDRAYVVQYRMDELLVQQHTVSDGQATSVQEGTDRVQSLCRLSSYLVDVCRPGKPSMKGYPKISCRFDPRYWLSEKMNWPGSLDASHREEHLLALGGIDRDPPIL
jgi:hypothetical protein